MFENWNFYIQNQMDSKWNQVIINKVIVNVSTLVQLLDSLSQSFITIRMILPLRLKLLAPCGDTVSSYTSDPRQSILVEVHHSGVYSGLQPVLYNSKSSLGNCGPRCSVTSLHKKCLWWTFWSSDGLSRLWPLDQLLMQTFGYYICKWGDIRCSE